MEVAFDTSVLIGLLDPQDLWHSQAVALLVSTQSQELLIAPLP